MKFFKIAIAEALAASLSINSSAQENMGDSLRYPQEKHLQKVGFF